MPAEHQIGLAGADKSSADFAIDAIGVSAKQPRRSSGQREQGLDDRAKLRARAAQYLSWILATLAETTDEELTPEQPLAGGSMPRWRWNMTALQHSAWTLGQLVPYLRLNGRTPPMFTPF